jgi:hypothetical protein
MASSGAPLNYTTTIEPEKTASECVAMLGRHGAQEISMKWQGGEPVGLSFVIMTAFGPAAYSLPINVAGTHRALIQAANKSKIPRSKATEEQAKRVAWRVVRTWLEIQISLIEAGLTEFAQAMLPYMHTDGASSETVWERVQRQQLAIEG